MATPAQAAAATVGAGSLAAAGAYGITQAVNGSSEETTTEEQESQTDNTVPTPSTFTTEDLTSYNGKTLSFLKDDHLTKLVKLTDDNDEWWKWAFENKYSNKEGLTIETTFNELADSIALKNACKTAYEKEKAYFNTDNFLENIGSFCTSKKLNTLEPKVTVYQTSDSSSGYENGLLSVNENKDKLIKTKIGSGGTANNNDLWWGWAFKNIFKKTESKSSDFSGVNQAYSESDNAGSNKYLNNACDAAYKKPYANLKSTIAAPNLITDIKKFCSIAGEQTVFVLPEPASPTALTNADDSNYNVNDSLYKQSGNPAKLIKPVLETNQDWWEWSFNKNYPKDDASKAKLPKPFQKVDKSYDSTDTSPTEENPLALNKACQKSYSETKQNLGKTNEDGSLINTIKKFCTKGSNQELTLPS